MEFEVENLETPDLACTGVGVHQREVRGLHLQLPPTGIKFCKAVQEERAARGLEPSLRPTKHQRAEFEARMHIREEDLAVLKVEQRP